MNYYQLNIPVKGNQDETDMLIALLAEVGFESFEEAENQLIAYIPEKDYQPNLLEKIDYCRQPDVVDKITQTFIPDQNWNEVWESNYPLVTISDRCVVRAPFHQPVEGVEFDIVVKPKMAFGTAHHETTAQMLEMMLDQDLSGKMVLDMGCGTGVLAILCSMKGATEVLAIDNDEWSYNNTVENAEINGITNIMAVLGDADNLQPPMAFDVILANINKNILMRDMPVYADVLKAGGHIFFSGFYTEDLPDMVTNATKSHLTLVESRAKNNWVVAHFIKG